MIAKRRSDIAKLDKRLRRFCPEGPDTYRTGRYVSSRGCKLCNRASAKKWASENREWANKRNNLWHKQNKESRLNSRLKYYYGIGLEDFIGLQEVQNHKCAVCNQTKKLVIDHSHETDQVRGLLCTECNLFVVPTVERFNSVIPNALKYLEEFNAKTSV